MLFDINKFCSPIEGETFGYAILCRSEYELKTCCKKLSVYRDDWFTTDFYKVLDRFIRNEHDDIGVYYNVEYQRLDLFNYEDNASNIYKEDIFYSQIKWGNQLYSIDDKELIAFL